MEKIRTMSLYRHNMEKILSGRKTVEIRVAYPNSSTMASGQWLKFLSSDRSCLTKILRVTRYASFDAMLDAEDQRRIGYDASRPRGEILERLRKLYPPNKEALGVLAIEVSKVSPEERVLAEGTQTER